MGHWWGVEGAEDIWGGPHGVRVTVEPKLVSRNTEEGKGGSFRARMLRSFWEWVGPFFGHSKAKYLALGRLKDEKMEEMSWRAHPMQTSLL